MIVLRPKVFIILSLIFLILFGLTYHRFTTQTYIVFTINYLILISQVFLIRGNSFTPIFTISSFWLNTLWLNTLQVTWVNYLSHLEKELEVKYIVLYYLALFVFVGFFRIGYLYIINPPNGKKSTENPIAILNASKYAFLIGGTVLAASILYKGQVPVFSEDINEVRDDLYLPVIGILVVLLQVAVATALIYITNSSLEQKQKRIAFLVLILAFLMMLSTSQRIGIIESLILGFMLWLPYKEKLKVSVPVAIGSVFFILITFTGFILVGIARGLNELFLTDFDNLVAEQVYIYFGGPSLKNLQYAIESNFEIVRQSVSMPFILRGFLRVFTGFPGVDMGELFTGPNNGTAFLFYVYDFGLFGFFFPVLLLGFITGISCKQYFIHGKLLWGLLFGVLISCALFIPLTDKFFEFSTLIKIVVFTIFAAIIRSKKSAYSTS